MDWGVTKALKQAEESFKKSIENAILGHLERAVETMAPKVVNRVKEVPFYFMSQLTCYSHFLKTKSFNRPFKSSDMKLFCKYNTYNQ